jgi:hypothetical protein
VAGGLGVRGIVSAMKPPKRVRLEEPLGVLVNLNLSDYSVRGNLEEDKESIEEAAPDLVLLSSTSSEDKTQEERLEDVLQLWDSLVRTIKGLAASFCSIQRKHGQTTDAMDERTSTLESMVGQCAYQQLKEDYITVWDAIAFFHSSLEVMGKTLNDLQANRTMHDNLLNEKIKALEDSA